MPRKHPFRWLSPLNRSRFFAVTALLTGGLLVVFQLIDRPLQTPAAPFGIVSFELAGSLGAAEEMLKSWNQPATMLAGFGLGIDYLFLLLYPTAIGLGLILLAHKLRPYGWLPVAAVLLAWALYVAAALDAIENFALMQTLLGSQQPFWPVLAQWCAIPKFLIVGLGLACLIVGGAVYMLRRRHYRHEQA